jgi:hypothetical protein
VPSFCLEDLDFQSISLDVFLELVSPKNRVGFWNSEQRAIFVAMPKTAMNENNRMIFRKNDIRGSGIPFIVDPISKTTGEKEFSNDNFWFGVLTPNPRH